MPDLDFRIEGVEAVKFAASPQIAFKLQVTNSQSEQRRSIPLHFAARFKSRLRVVDIQRKISRNCATCSANPTDGAKLCATCFGRTST